MNNREWLYGMEPSELSAWFDAEHVEPNDGIKPESVVRADSMDANDSREKLEDDVGFIVKEGFVTYKSIIGWLDRQAAITANETNYNNPYVGLVRGKQWERTEISDYYCGRCGWKVTDHDSYCPECGGALHKAPNKPDGKSDAPKTAETPETDTAKGDIRDFDDSREKLEADKIEAINSFLREHHGAISWNDELRLMSDEWLDRQAAITEREIAARNLANWRKWCEEMGIQCTKERVGEQIAELQRERDDLKAQMDEILEGDKATDAINVELLSRIDKLQEALDQQRAATANANDLWGRTRDELAAVKAERDNLADDLLASNREREHLREALGIALDHAHDVLALMDGGLA